MARLQVLTGKHAWKAMFDLAGGFFLCEYDLEAILSLSKLVNHSCIKNSGAAVVDGNGLIMLNKIRGYGYLQHIHGQNFKYRYWI